MVQLTDRNVCRLHERETRSRRVVLVARVTEAIPTGAFVGLVDVRGELFLRVVDDHTAADLVTAQDARHRTHAAIDDN